VPFTEPIPERIVNLTLYFSLFNNGEGRNLNSSAEFDEICKVFPITRALLDIKLHESYCRLVGDLLFVRDTSLDDSS
jgi:hypothetical protein